MFCQKCGNQIMEGANFCDKCGSKVEISHAAQEPQYRAPEQSQNQQQYYAPAQSAAPVNSNNSLVMVIKIFLIVGCVINGIVGYLIPLIWCIPMTISIFKSLKTGRPVGMAMKICTLLFVSLVSGICLLVIKDDESAYNR